MSEKTMTPAKLDEIAKRAVRNYMNEIKEHGGIDHEQALYGLFLEIVVTLETQHGKADAKQVMKEFLEELHSRV